MDFYPSISRSLLEKAVKFTREYCVVTTTEEAIIMNSRKTILFSGEEQWLKKMMFLTSALGPTLEQR